MILFIILGVIVLITVVVLAVLFILLNKEGQKVEDVPVKDMAQIKKELNSHIFEPNIDKVVENNSEIIPVFQPRVSLPIQPPISDMDQVIKDPTQEEKYKKRAEELEDELKDILKKADGQSDEARVMIEDLKKENESLKSQKASLEVAQQKLNEIQQEASSLKTDNINLQSQLEETNAKVHFLENEMAAVKIQMGNEIAEANRTVEQLNQEKQELLSAPKPGPDKILSEELDTLKLKLTELNQQSDDMKRTEQKLRELNTHLIEKNEMLQYELIKARAQSSGLERVSFNYKNQLEDFFKKVNAYQSTNDQLFQVKNRLENMIQEVKLENEDLVKKDQLSQFELEKNRSRLASLEKEYDELKTSIQQQPNQGDQ